MSNLTPVEVLDSNISQLKEYIAVSNARSIEPVMAVQFLAALELAKADAEVIEHSKLEPKCSGSEWNEWATEKAFIESVMASARIKLYEILHR